MSKRNKFLGLPACASLVVGNMIGSGIFLLPAVLSNFGSISLIGWLVTAVGALFLAYIFGEFSKELNLTGGPYVYCKKYLGDFFGYHVNICYLLANIIGNVAIIITAISYCTVFFPILGGNHMYSLILGVSTIWLTVWINVLGLKTFKYVQIIVTVLKVIPIILVIVFGFKYIKIENLMFFNMSNMSNFSAIASSSMIALFAFAGLESCTVPVSNIRNPQSIIKKATIIGTVFTSLIYILSTFILIGIFSPQVLVNSNAPFADAGALIFGKYMHQVFALAAIATCFCTALGFLFVTGHAACAAANDNFLPKFIGNKNDKTPVRAFYCAGLIMTLIYLLIYNHNIFMQFHYMLSMSNLFLLIPYLCISISAIISCKINKNLYFIIISLLSCAYMLFAVLGVGKDILLGGLLFLLILSFIYYKNFNKNRKFLQLG